MYTRKGGAVPEMPCKDVFGEDVGDMGQIWAA